MSVKIPKHFVSLQEFGYKCDNYYVGSGGLAIGLTPEILAEVGFTNDTLWVHPDLIDPLHKFKNYLYALGFGLIIKDAWRPKALYKHIAKHRKSKGLPVDKFLNLQSMPHATGMAIDIVLTCSVSGRVIWTRDQPRDGDDSCFYGFYKDQGDYWSKEYHKLQTVMVESAQRAGFELGSKNEYFHHQLPRVNELFSRRY